MGVNWSIYYDNHYFSREEIACPCCGNTYMKNGFLQAVVELRVAYGHGVVPNSVCRCRKYNASLSKRKSASGKKLKPAKASSHISEKNHPCCAIDWPVSGGARKYKLVQLAMRLGFSVGVYKNFLHLDKRSGTPMLWWGGY